MNKVFDFYTANKKNFLIITILILVVLFIMPFITMRKMDIDKEYTDRNDVALYIMQYHELPPNYVTKYGLDYLNKNDMLTNEYVMGGDTHINNGSLEDLGVRKNQTLKECDVATSGYSIKNNRGVARLVYTCNTQSVRVFYTTNHYSSFQEITEFELQLVSSIFWIIFACYAIVFVVFYIYIFIQSNKIKS